MSEKPALFVGIDLGTSSSKAVLVDGTGREVSSGSAPHPVHSRRAGWAESDPADWWASVRQAVRGALENAPEPVEASQVAAIGLSGQMHGAVLVNGDGDAIRPAILWADERAEPELGRYQSLASDCTAPLGNPLVAGMTGPILCWLAEFEPESYHTATSVLQSKDWLRLRLTGSVGTEHSDASATLLYDLVRRDWADDVVAGLGLRRDLMARLHASAEPAGVLTGAAAEEVGLRPGTTVAYGAGDVPAALAGTGLAEHDVLQLTVGTGAQIVTLRDAPRPDDALRYHVFASAEGGYYALAAVQAAGLAFEWAWRSLACDWHSAYAALAASPAGANGVSFVPHLAGARSPSMDARATAAFCGVRLANDRSDLIRAVFEGVAFSILDAVRALPEYETAAEVRLAGGGTTNAAWRQLLADVLDRSLVVLPEVNASARGAAILGSLAVGAGPASAAERAAGVRDVVDPHPPAATELATAYRAWSERAAAIGRRNAA